METTPDPKSYADWYLRFLTLKRMKPDLAHADHEPQPAKFGVSERDAAFIRERVKREYERKF